MSNRERVLEFLRNAGHAGATNEQILSHTGIRPHQQVFMITRELSRLGKIKGIQSGKEWRFWVSGTQTPVARSEAPPLKTRAAARQNGIAMPAQFNMTAAEDRYLLKILAKDKVLRGLLEANRPSSEPAELLAYLTAVKNALGNLNNDMSFVASLLVKPFLRKRFGIAFDAAVKAQGAPGADIECIMPDGARIIGEIKTTKPYQPGFGAAQKKEIRKDLLRLAGSTCAYRFMFVTDSESYRTICGKLFAACAPGIEIVNLVTGECFVCPRNSESLQVSAGPTPI